MFQCVGYDVLPAGRLRINGVERTEPAQMRMVTVTFFQQQTVPQSDFIVHDRRLRQFFADLEPERIGRFSQQFCCFEQVFRQTVQRGKLKTGVASPGVNIGPAVFRRDRDRQRQQTVFSGFQHGRKNVHHTFHEIINIAAQIFHISGVIAVIKHHHGDPGGTAVVNGSGPEITHAAGAVVHRMRQHVAVFDSRETARIVPEFAAPRQHQVKQFFQVCEFSGFQTGQAAQLDIDVEMVISLPRRQPVILDPRPLKPRRNPARIGHDPIFVQTVPIQFLHRGIVVSD